MVVLVAIVVSLVYAEELIDLFSLVIRVAFIRGDILSSSAIILISKLITAFITIFSLEFLK